MRVTMMRIIETFPLKQMYPYLSLVERKVAEFYLNIDRMRWLVWLKWLIFITFSGQLMVSLIDLCHKFTYSGTFKFTKKQIVLPPKHCGGGRAWQICPTDFSFFPETLGGSDLLKNWLTIKFSQVLVTSFLRYSYLFFIGPESDHWLCLSLTDSLTAV